MAFRITSILLLSLQHAYGQGWVTQPSGTSADLTAVACIDSATAVAVGSGGTIIRTTDGGASWLRQPSGISFSLSGVFFLNRDTGFAVGDYGTILRTTDAGLRWSAGFDTSGQNLRKIFFTGPSNGTIVGDAGLILHSSDGGTSWLLQASGTVHPLTGVYFSNPMTGIAVGTGVILRTFDGGMTWLLKPSGRIVDVAFADPLNGIAPTTDGYIFKTSDGGRTWSSQSFGFSFSSVCYPGNDAAFVIGPSQSGTVIMRTIDGGTHWFEEDSYSSIRCNDISSVDGNRAIAVGQFGLILRTTDGGGLFKPPLISPRDNYPFHLGAMPLRWHSVPGASSYRVQVATDPQFLHELTILDAVVPDTFAFLPQVTVGQQYYWGVQIIQGGEGPWSATRSFTIADYPLRSVREIQGVPADSLLVADSVQYQDPSRWTLQATPLRNSHLAQLNSVCTIPAGILYDPASGVPLMAVADAAATGSAWNGLVLDLSACPVKDAFFTLRRRDGASISGGVWEIPPGTMNSMTTYFPDDFLIQNAQKVPPLVVKEISDFHTGGYSTGHTSFSGGEPFEGVLVEFHNVAVMSYVNRGAGTVNLADDRGNTIPTSDQSVWFTLGNHRHPLSTFVLPPLGARIDTIRGVIMSSPTAGGFRVYKIAPVFPGDIVYGPPRHGVIRGKVVDDFNRDSTLLSLEPGIPNWPVTIDGKVQSTLTTDQQGGFSLTGLDSGSYTLSQGTLPGWSPTFPSAGFYTIKLGLDDTATVFFGNHFPWNTIAGSVFHDLDENGRRDFSDRGLPGWRVRLFGNTADSALTDSSGHYYFGRVDAGITSVSVESQPSWEQILPRSGQAHSFDIRTFGKNYTGLDFSFHIIPRRIRVALTVYDSSRSNRRDIWFGLRAGATYGVWGVDPHATNIDFSEGEFEIPPQTYGLFDARFVDPRDSLDRFGYGSWIDVRDYVSSSQSDTFKISFRPGYFFDGDYPVTILWPRKLLENTFSGPLIMTDSLGSAVDMKAADSIIVTNPAISSLTFISRGPLMPSAVSTPERLPAAFVLEQNFPNPFNPTTTIRYQLPRSAHVVISVFDLLGRQIVKLVEEQQQAGTRSVTWNAAGLPTGIYFCRLTAGDYIGVKKMLIIR